MARTSVICETPEVVRHLTDSLKKCPEVGHIGRMKNGFGSSAVGRGGYRDIKVNLRPSAVAHYVEVQVGHEWNAKAVSRHDSPLLGTAVPFWGQAASFYIF